MYIVEKLYNIIMTQQKSKMHYIRRLNNKKILGLTLIISMILAFLFFLLMLYGIIDWPIYLVYIFLSISLISGIVLLIKIWLIKSKQIKNRALYVLFSVMISLFFITILYIIGYVLIYWACELGIIVCSYYV